MGITNNKQSMKTFLNELRAYSDFEDQRESKYKGQLEELFRAKYRTLKDGKEHISIEKGYTEEDVRDCLLQENTYDRVIRNNDGYEVIEIRKLTTSKEIYEVIDEMVENGINNGLTRDQSMASVTEVLECLEIIPDYNKKQ